MSTRGVRTALLRADATVETGTGHVYRCLALASELNRRGWRTIFASRPLPESLRKDVMAQGHTLLVVPDDVGTAAEPGELAKRLPASGVDATVVDHYDIAADWHEKARAWTRLIAAIDDVAASELSVDVVVNQNLGTADDTYDGLVPEGCVSLIGPRFAMLRPEFARHRDRGLRTRRAVERALIFMSGADEPNATAKAVRAVGALSLPADVVVGAAYPHLEALTRQCAAYTRVRLHRHTPHMAALMSEADVSIGAPSSASWERCCLGLPTILMTLAENQVNAGAALASSGAAINLGWFFDVDAEDVQDALERLIREPAVLKEMSHAAAVITDGRGSFRVASALEAVLTTQEGGRLGRGERHYPASDAPGGHPARP